MNSDQKMLNILKRQIELSKSNSAEKCIAGNILYTYTFEEARRYQNILKECGFQRNPLGLTSMTQRHLNEFKL